MTYEQILKCQKRVTRNIHVNTTYKQFVAFELEKCKLWSSLLQYLLFVMETVLRILLRMHSSDQLRSHLLLMTNMNNDVSFLLFL